MVLDVRCGGSPGPGDDVLQAATRPLPIDDVAVAVRAHFGLEGWFAPLPGERDQNLLMVTEDGTRFVVKIANPAEDPAVIDLQVKALVHLAAADGGLPVPIPRACRDGGNIVTFMPSVAGGSRLVWLLDYLDGVPLDRAPPSRRQHAALGRLAGRLTRALHGFRHPAEDRKILWDLARADAVRAYVPHVGGDLRAPTARTLDRFADLVAPQLADLPQQVVHNDFNPHNLLVDSHDPGTFVGVIDFGDMVRTARAADVAIAASYLLRHASAADAVADFVEAASAEHRLSRSEVEVLPDLMAARLATSIVIGEWRASRRPAERSYILRNHAAAALGLARLEEIGRTSLAMRLRTVAGVE